MRLPQHVRVADALSPSAMTAGAPARAPPTLTPGRPRGIRGDEALDRQEHGGHRRVSTHKRCRDACGVQIGQDATERGQGL